MRKMPVLSGRKVIKILGKIGFHVARQKGSHIVVVKESDGNKKALVVPDHKEIDKGTLKEIIRQAGLKKEDFLKLI